MTNSDYKAHSAPYNDGKVKDTLFMQELEPAFNVNVGSENWCFIKLF